MKREKKRLTKLSTLILATALTIYSPKAQEFSTEVYYEKIFPRTETFEYSFSKLEKKHLSSGPILNARTELKKGEKGISLDLGTDLDFLSSEKVDSFYWGTKLENIPFRKLYFSPFLYSNQERIKFGRLKDYELGLESSLKLSENTTLNAKYWHNRDISKEDSSNRYYFELIHKF
jgi:hypothetical protein